MADRTAYERISRLALARMADSADSTVAHVARAVADGMSHVAETPHRFMGETWGERLERVRMLVCASPFDRNAFQSAVTGIEDCAEKRYLMAVAALRAAGGGTVPMSAAEDLTRAMRLDPGNVEYIAFASILIRHLRNSELERAIAEEREFIRSQAARGVSEKGRWVEQWYW